jgi:D-alanine-D-alanine ligase
MDKSVMKVVFRAEGLRVPDWITIRRSEWESGASALSARVAMELGFPVFVKPANMGSSVGISKVHDLSELGGAIELAFTFDRKVVVEKAVADAREIECGVIGNDVPEVSVPGEIIPSAEFYDYEAKYLSGSSEERIPADLPAQLADEIRRQAALAFRAIDGSGLARVDFLLSRSTGDLFINEINTLPGFTTISMFAKLWSASHVPYATLIDRLIALAIARHAEKQHLRTSAL